MGSACVPRAVFSTLTEHTVRSTGRRPVQPGRLRSPPRVARSTHVANPTAALLDENLFPRRVAEEYQEKDEHGARAKSGRHPDFAPVVLDRTGRTRERVQGEDF